MTYEAAIAALADPTRRAIIERLRSGPCAVGVVAAGLPVSRPAVSQHLRILSDAGLVTVIPKGTARLYQLAPTGIDGLRHYLDSLWNDALDAFRREAERQAKKPPNRKDQTP